MVRWAGVTLGAPAAWAGRAVDRGGGRVGSGGLDDEAREDPRKLADLLGKPLIPVMTKTLDRLVEEYGALPNWRMRWCTRQIKVEPTKAFLKSCSRKSLICQIEKLTKLM